jgi:type II secretory pathway component PulM
MSNIIQKWSALKESEQTLLLFGVPLILITILYFYLWVPYHKSIDEMHQKINDTQEEIAWLNKVALQVKQLKSNSPQSSVGSFSGSFINTIDKSINKNRLNKYLSILEKSGKNNVLVKLDKINFDQLIKFVGYIKNRYGILIKTIDVQRTENGKLVNSRLILKKIKVL